MTRLSRCDRNLAISDDVTATFGLPKAHKDAVLSHRTAVLGMTAFGASRPLPFVSAKVPCLITQWGFPCCVRFPCVHAAATTPVQRLGVVFAHLTHPCQPSPVPRPGRPAHRPFRGLLSVHSRCGLHTRAVTQIRDRYPGASDISSPPCLPRLLPAGALAGRGLHPLEKRRLVTAHVDFCRSRFA